MLTAGTKISYNTEGHEDQSQTGTVKSCNKRGTTCVVELRPGVCMFAVRCLLHSKLS